MRDCKASSETRIPTHPFLFYLRCLLFPLLSALWLRDGCSQHDCHCHSPSQALETRCKLCNWDEMLRVSESGGERESEIKKR